MAWSTMDGMTWLSTTSRASPSLTAATCGTSPGRSIVGITSVASPISTSVLVLTSTSIASAPALIDSGHLLGLRFLSVGGGLSGGGSRGGHLGDRGFVAGPHVVRDFHDLDIGVFVEGLV